MSIKSLLKTAGGILQKNSPYILTGLGCAGVVSTAVMTGRAAFKAKETIYEHESDDWGFKDRLDYLDRPWKQRIVWTWKYFIPPLIMGSASVACIIGAQSVSTKRTAALASLYTLTDQTLKDYQEKVVETIGERKEQKIKDDIVQDKLLEQPITKQNLIRTSYGDTICFDVHSGRYFTHDMEVLRRIQNDFNQELINVMWMSLNDLYYLMGLEGIKLGDELGWTCDELLEFHFTSKLTDDGRPCLVVDYDLTPRSLRTRSLSSI